MACKNCGYPFITVKHYKSRFGDDDYFNNQDDYKEYICEKCGNRGNYEEVVDDKEFKKLLEEI